MRIVGVFAILFMMSVQAQAVQVVINVAGYSGKYKVSGSPLMSGNKILDLGAGIHYFTTANGAYIRFAVDINGYVLSGNSNVADGGPGGLYLKTVDMEVNPVDPNAYYSLFGGAWVRGPQKFKVIVNMLQRLSPYGQAGQDFTIDQFGRVVIGNLPSIIDYTSENCGSDLATRTILGTAYTTCQLP